MKVSVIGDGMIEANDIVKAAKKLDIKNLKIEMTNWILDKVELQRVRREREVWTIFGAYLTGNHRQSSGCGDGFSTLRAPPRGSN